MRKDFFLGDYSQKRLELLALEKEVSRRSRCNGVRVHIWRASDGFVFDFDYKRRMLRHCCAVVEWWKRWLPSGSIVEVFYICEV